MYCPNLECPDLKETGSSGEYIEGTSICPYCGSALVHQLPNAFINEDDDETRFVEAPKGGMQKLSSDWTFIYKFLFPIFWIGFLGYNSVAMFMAPGSFGPRSSGAETRVILSLATVLGTIGLYWLVMRLKAVALKGQTLVISNFNKIIEVPLHDVERVSGSVFISPELVWLHFLRPTEFGQKVVFMGKLRFSFGFTVHPIVKKLQVAISSRR
jgi:hypothetical protein